MNVVDLLATLDRRKVRLSLDGGRLVVTPPPAGLPINLVDPIKAVRLQLAWAAAGADTGHHWAACDTCNEPMLVRLNHNRPDRACVTTHGCNGRLRLTTSPPPRRSPPP